MQGVYNRRDDSTHLLMVHQTAVDCKKKRILGPIKGFIQYMVFALSRETKLKLIKEAKERNVPWKSDLRQQVYFKAEPTYLMWTIKKIKKTIKNYSRS